MLTSPLCGNHSLAGKGKQKKIKQQSVQLHSVCHVVLQFYMEGQCKEKADMWVKFHACQRGNRAEDTYLPSDHSGRDQGAIAKKSWKVKMGRSCRDRYRWGRGTRGSGEKIKNGKGHRGVDEKKPGWEAKEPLAWPRKEGRGEGGRDLIKNTFGQSEWTLTQILRPLQTKLSP